MIRSYLLIYVILFVSTFIHSTLGFGQALIAMPLLAMVVELKSATPLVAFVLMTIAAVILLRNWRVVDLSAVWRLVLSSCLGIPVGLFLLKGIPEGLMKAFLSLYNLADRYLKIIDLNRVSGSSRIAYLFGFVAGIVGAAYNTSGLVITIYATLRNWSLGILVILFSLYNLADRYLKIIDLNRVSGSSRIAYLFGFVAGIVGAAYNTSGLVITIYATLRNWSPDRFRSTLQSYFVFTGILILASHGLAGLWTPYVLRLYVTALPLVLVAIFLGGKLNRFIPQGQFDGYVNVGLLLMGFLLFR